MEVWGYNTPTRGCGGNSPGASFGTIVAEIVQRDDERGHEGHILGRRFEGECVRDHGDLPLQDGDGHSVTQYGGGASEEFALDGVLSFFGVRIKTGEVERLAVHGGDPVALCVLDVGLVADGIEPTVADDEKRVAFQVAHYLSPAYAEHPAFDLVNGVAAYIRDVRASTPRNELVFNENFHIALPLFRKQSGTPAASPSELPILASLNPIIIIQQDG